MTNEILLTATDALKHNLWSQTPTPTHTYSPSVPLNFYRELAAELQAAEAMLDLQRPNQHLTKQNQRLRQEIPNRSVRFASTAVVDSTGSS